MCPRLSHILVKRFMLEPVFFSPIPSCFNRKEKKKLQFTHRQFLKEYFFLYCLRFNPDKEELQFQGNRSSEYMETARTFVNLFEMTIPRDIFPDCPVQSTDCATMILSTTVLGRSKEQEQLHCPLQWHALNFSCQLPVKSIKYGIEQLSNFCYHSLIH